MVIFSMSASWSILEKCGVELRPDPVRFKGKSAIPLARVYGERRRNFVGQHFWARGYFVSTVGRDDSRHQEKEDARLDQWVSGVEPATFRWRTFRGRASDPDDALSDS